MIDQSLLQALSSPDAATRLETYQGLGDYFQDYRSWEPGEAEAVAERLLARLGQEHDYELQEALLHALLQAYGSGEQIVLALEPLLAALDHLPPSLAHYAFEILYLSGLPQYHESFRQYLRHPDPGVRKLAAEKLRLLQRHA